MIAALIFVLYMSGYLLFSSDSYFRPTDFLDGSVVRYKILNDNNLVFENPDKIIRKRLEVPRLSYGTKWDVQLWLHRVLGSFWGVAANVLLMRLIAFFGFILLLGNYLIREGYWSGYLPYLGLLFSLLPFWIPGGLSIAGMPLLLYCFLKVGDRDASWYHWLFIIFFPFYSKAVFAGYGIVVFLGIWIAADLIRKKKLRGPLVIGTGLLIASYVFVEFETLRFLLDKDWVPHRASFQQTETLGEAMKKTLNTFIKGQWHAKSSHILVYLPLTLVTLTLIAARKKLGANRNFTGLIASAVIISLVHGFYRWEPIFDIRENFFLLKQMQLDRFYIFLPLIWPLLYVGSMGILKKYLSDNNWRTLFIATLTIQLALLFYQGNTFKSILNKVDDQKVITFKEFYSEDLFTDIENALDKRESGTYKVACLGFYPGIAAFNGMSTAGGYYTLYPLEEKKEFLEIIEKELQKNPELNEYFTKWGSRSYIFDDEIGLDFLCTKDKNATTEKIELDFKALEERNVQYLLSAVELEWIDTTKMRELGNYVNDTWDITVYEINP